MTPINNLFLIDDDAVFNHIHTRAIEKIKFANNIKAFQDPLIALDELRQLVISGADMLPQIVFLDVNMPAMDGWDFLEQLVDLPEMVFENCRIVMLSSSIDPSDIERSKMYKMVFDFISKPLTPLKLTALSNKLLDLFSNKEYSRE
jgi:CheY-like chemotaxis protein